MYWWCSKVDVDTPRLWVSHNLAAATVAAAAGSAVPRSPSLPMEVIGTLRRSNRNIGDGMQEMTCL